MIPQEIYHIMDTLENRGYEALIVGGAVRDKMLGFVPKDYDLATDATPDEVQLVIELMGGYKYIMSADSEQARRALTSLVLTPSGEQVEITTYRAELGYEGGDRAKPIAIPAKTFEEDSSRRDITINSMGMDKGGKIYDPMGGQIDLDKGIVRAVGNPSERFQEDALRMIRAIRFTVRFDFTLDSETEKAIRDNVKLVTSLSPNRLRIEVGKVLYYPNGFRMLMETGILPELMPEMRNLKQYKHNLKYHPEGNVYNHYIKTFETFTTLLSRTELGGWATLFHDIAKPETAYWGGEFHTYHGHDRVGRDLILERYKLKPFQFSTKELTALAWTTEKHLQQFWEMMKPTKLAEMANNEYYSLLLQVVYADSMGYHDEQMAERIDYIESIKTQVNERNANAGQRPKDFAMRVFTELNIPVGKARGQVMNEIEDLISSGQALTYDDALRFVKGEGVSFEASCAASLHSLTQSGFSSVPEWYLSAKYGNQIEPDFGIEQESILRFKYTKKKSRFIITTTIYPLNFSREGYRMKGKEIELTDKVKRLIPAYEDEGRRAMEGQIIRPAPTLAAEEHYTDGRPMSCPICIRELSSYDSPSADV